MANAYRNPFGARASIDTAKGPATYFRLDKVAEAAGVDLHKLPFSIRILLENLVRHCDGELVTEEDVLNLARWTAQDVKPIEIPFMPSRVVLQDFTGVPAVVDLAAMRAAIQRAGGDPEKINPLIPADLVIDHSVQVDLFGTPEALAYNVEKEYERNAERYAVLRWAQQAFRNFRVVPPGTGIVHQVNLEYLAQVVHAREEKGELMAFPDTCVGTDSHTTMVNALGVIGWGVGGIEAEAAMLGQPYYMLTPEVIGFRLTGTLPEGATATDLVLTVTEMLRQKGVVGKFVEFFGPGLDSLGLADRATLANMAPEYGATMGFFPVDDETLHYLRATGRDEALVDLVERYCKAQGLFRSAGTPDPVYTDVLELDMGDVVPSLAGPRRPQDRIPLSQMKSQYRETMANFYGRNPEVAASAEGGTAVATKTKISDGAVVIAAITSCTNTSNPSVMVGAGLLARNAVKAGLKTAPHVKTSLAPGSRVVTDYLDAAGLTPYLEQLGFHTVGYGCTTCIGNSGSLPPHIIEEIEREDLIVAGVLSGNRNFEGRINPHVRLNYLASPMLVVAYALAGTVDIDLTTEPLGYNDEGEPVYLADIWPSQEEIKQTVAATLKPEMFVEQYAKVFEGDERWKNMPVPQGAIYTWDPDSTYIQEPPFFVDMPERPEDPQDIVGARALAVLGDSITTDHISPAGAIPAFSPAGEYLRSRGVDVRDFNTYGARRGGHDVMMRGTFANIRLRNRMVDGKEGGYTRHQPSGEEMTIYDAAMRYKEEGTPLVVIAGSEYGTGSSRDWAAKGTYLLGVRAVIAKSFERIHRSNLVGMGVLPLQFLPGEDADSLGLDGTEEYSITGISEGITPGKRLTVTATKPGGRTVSFQVTARIDSPVEVEYYRHGGILQYVLRSM